jgi:hypothetical protein
MEGFTIFCLIFCLVVTPIWVYWWLEMREWRRRNKAAINLVEVGWAKMVADDYSSRLALFMLPMAMNWGWILSRIWLWVWRQPQ